MVYCHPQRGHRYGVQCQHKLWVDREYAFYDRAVLQAGKKEVFVSVLLPHDSSVEPYDICRKKNEGGCLEPWARKHDREGVKLEAEKTKGIVTEIKDRRKRRGKVLEGGFHKRYDGLFGHGR